MSSSNLHGGPGGGQLHPDEEGPQDLPLPAQVSYINILFPSAIKSETILDIPNGRCE